LRSGWLTHGPYNKQFEADFARYMGVDHAISMNSCASALHLALLAQDIRGEVIIPSFTWVATANAVMTAGAKPVFADIQYDSCNIDPRSIESLITARTEAIMPVHYAGQPCDLSALTAIARKHKLALIEDSAETIGARYKGRQVGTFGTGCFSFFPTKNMTTGEGGMLVTSDAAIARRARAYVGHGVSSSTLKREKEQKPWLRSAVTAGYNFRLSNIQAALGVGQLVRLDEMNNQRKKWAALYNAKLAHLSDLELPRVPKGMDHVYQMYTVKLHPRIDRTRFLANLRGKGVGATVHFDPPVHKQPYYAPIFRKQKTALPVTEDVAARIVTLPLFPTMTRTQIDHVVKTIEQALKENRS
jgi:perosamine synthetase